MIEQKEARERGFIPLAEAVRILGEDRTTLWRKVKNGTLPGIEVKKGSRPVQWVKAIALDSPISLKKENDYCLLREEWLDGMLKGICSHRNVPLSEEYVNGVLRWGLNKYWTILGEKPSISGINIDNFSRVMSSDALSVDFSQRKDYYDIKMHIYKACTRFIHFLISKELKQPSDLQALKNLKPGKRFKTQKKMLELEAIQEALAFNRQWFDGRCRYDMELMDMLISLYAFAGLRRMGAAGLRIKDINFEKRRMLVQEKGCKERYVVLYLFDECDLTAKLRRWIREIRVSSNSEHVLVSKEGKPLTKSSINHRMRRLRQAMNYDKAYKQLAQESNYTLPPETLKEKASVMAKTMQDGVRAHALRRSFVTILSNRGWPMPMLQELVGHSDIRTTMGYNLTTLDHIEKLAYEKSMHVPQMEEISTYSRQDALMSIINDI